MSDNGEKFPKKKSYQKERKGLSDAFFRDSDTDDDAGRKDDGGVVEIDDDDDDAFPSMPGLPSAGTVRPWVEELSRPLRLTSEDKAAEFLQEHGWMGAGLASPHDNGRRCPDGLWQPKHDELFVDILSQVEEEEGHLQYDPSDKRTSVFAKWTKKILPCCTGQRPVWPALASSGWLVANTS